MDFECYCRLLSDLKKFKDLKCLDQILSVNITEQFAIIECLDLKKNVCAVKCCLKTLCLENEGKQLGYLHIPIESSDKLLNCYQNVFLSGYKIKQINNSIIEIVPMDKDNFVLSLHFPWDEKNRRMELLDISNKHLMSYFTETEMKEVIASVTQACKNFWETRYQINVQQLRTFRQYNFRPKEDFMAIIIKKDPEFLERLRFCLYTNAYYYCEPDTNLWIIIHYATLKCKISDLIFKEMDLLEQNYLESILNGLINYILHQVQDINFAVNLNKCSHLISFKDGHVYDVKIRNFRKLAITDFNEQFLDWNYDAEKSKQFINDVTDYLDSFFESDRDKNLTFSYIINRLLNNGEEPTTNIILSLPLNAYPMLELIYYTFEKMIKISSYELPFLVNGSEKLIFVQNQILFDDYRYVNVKQITEHKCGIVNTMKNDIQNYIPQVYTENMILLNATDGCEFHKDRTDIQSAVFDYLLSFILDDRKSPVEIIPHFYNDEEVLKNFLDEIIQPGKYFISLGKLYRKYRAEKGKTYDYSSFGHLTRKILANEGYPFKSIHAYKRGNDTCIVRNVFMQCNLRKKMF